MEGRVWGETSSSVFHKEIDGKYSVGVTYTKDKPVYVFSDIRFQMLRCGKRQDFVIENFKIMLFWTSWLS